MSLFRAKTVQQRPLMPREVETRLPDCQLVAGWQRLPAGDTLPAIADILFYWIRIKIVQQLTSDLSNIGRSSGPDIRPVTCLT